MAISHESMYGFLSKTLQVPDVVEMVLKMETKLRNNDVLENLRTHFNKKEETFKTLAYNVYDNFRYKYEGPYFVHPSIHFNLSNFINYLVESREPNMSIFIQIYTTIVNALSSWMCHKDFIDFLMATCDGSPVSCCMFVEVLEYMLKLAI
jgi:hypothetical protein